MAKKMQQKSNNLSDLTSKIITIPNIISAFRIILIPIIFALIATNSLITDIFGIILIIIASISDALDGYIARKFNSITKLGKILDPLADRLFIFFMLFALLSREIIPLAFLLLIVMRELILLTFYILAVISGYQLPEVKKIGKIGAAGLMVGVCLLYFTTCLYSYRALGVNADTALNGFNTALFVALCGILVVYYYSGVQYIIDIAKRAFDSKNWIILGMGGIITLIILIIFIYYTIIAIPFAAIFGTL